MAVFKEMKTVTVVKVPLTNLETAVENEAAAYDTATGKATVAANGSTTLLPIGYFDEGLVGDGTTPVRVRLPREYNCRWYANDAGGTPVVAATHRFQNCYMLDGVTVTAASAGNSVRGTVIDVDATRGVLVAEKEF